MPYFKSSQEWLDQSALLLEARPVTTRITTKYHIAKPSIRTPKPDADPATTPSQPAAPRGSLVLKTYDPASGVTLKYRTTKAAEVSRLVYSALGKLGRGMAGMPDVPEEAMPDAGTPADGAGAKTQPAQQQGQQQQGGGGGKKKKKGRK